MKFKIFDQNYNEGGGGGIILKSQKNINKKKNYLFQLLIEQNKREGEVLLGMEIEVW